MVAPLDALPMLSLCSHLAGCVLEAFGEQWVFLIYMEEECLSRAVPSHTVCM